VEDAKSARDQFEALRYAARQAGAALELQNQCALGKLQAERRAGALLAAMPKAVNQHGGPNTLSGAGITYAQSSRWQQVASIPESRFDEWVAETMAAGRELTSIGARKLAKQDRPPVLHIAPLDGTYPTIVIDPPWRYDNRATRGAAEDHYLTMTIAELAELEIPSADDAHLYLWVTNGFLREGFALLDEWGFTYKTTLTWCKPQIGMGNWFRNSTEHVLFAVKGKQPTLRNDVPTWFVADRTRHSAKPESFYDLVESCSPGPFFEMFARRRRFGWEHWGDEA